MTDQHNDLRGAEEMDPGELFADTDVESGAEHPPLSSSGCADAPNSRGEPKKRSAQKYSLFLYLSVMFAVVIGLILLSYFVQGRNSAETIENITQQHTAFSVTALERIESLQDKNLALTQELDRMKDEARVREAELEEAEQALAAQTGLAADYEELLKKYNAVNTLMRLEAAIEARDTERAGELVEALETQRESLGEFAMKFDALKAKLER